MGIQCCFPLTYVTFVVSLAPGFTYFSFIMWLSSHCLLSFQNSLSESFHLPLLLERGPGSKRGTLSSWKLSLEESTKSRELLFIDRVDLLRILSSSDISSAFSPRQNRAMDLPALVRGRHYHFPEHSECGRALPPPLPRS